MFLRLFSFYLLLVFSLVGTQLDDRYALHVERPSDINEHLPVLRALSRECSSVVELGVRDMVATWGILKGLAESPCPTRSYLGVDLEYPPLATLQLAQSVAAAHGIAFDFLRTNDLTIKLEPIDLLFIDTLHTYCHLTYELETFSPSVKKYIVLHDTSDPWGNRDDHFYKGNYSEYPEHINREKRGLWPAVEDFLITHPQWAIKERRLNNHGLTVLKRLQ